jgi:hypothetical protein
MKGRFQPFDELAPELRKCNLNWRRLRFGMLVADFKKLRTDFNHASGTVEKKAIARKARDLVQAADRLVHQRAKVICIDRGN